MKYQKPTKAVVILADGTMFFGNAVGNVSGSVMGPVCFTTAMTGYEDFFIDPAYSGKIVVSAPAHIGGYGINNAEILSQPAQISGLIARNLGEYFSRPSGEKSLIAALEENNVIMVSDIDTRALVTHLRDNGAMFGVISTEVDDINGLKEKLHHLSINDSTKELLQVSSIQTAATIGDEASKYKIAILDLGLRKTLLDFLVKRDCFLKVYLFDSDFKELEEFNPDGYVIAGGPGNPMQMQEQLQLIKTIVASGKPVFAIGTGHNLLALTKGVNSSKMKIGHHGANHSVKNLITGKGEITVQNHDYVVNRDELESNPDLELTHVDLNDHSVEGFRIKNKPVFAVQYYPGGKPGPSDSEYLWDQFIELL